MNEQLVTGREDIFFGAEFDASAGTNKLPDDAVRYYIDTLASDPDHLRGSFEFYRAIPATIAQTEQRKQRRLTLPVLGSAEGKLRRRCREHEPCRGDVRPSSSPSGHWVAEQAPEQLCAPCRIPAPCRD